MDPFVAEVRIFPFSFAPKGWALCNGQLMPISQNTALFSLLGSTYGGDGKTNFALPDLQGRAPMYWGQGPGLSPHDIGETGGSTTVTLLESEIPIHNHSLGSQAIPLGSITTPAGATFDRPASGNLFNVASPTVVAMSPAIIGAAGGSQPHNNMQPFLAVNFCIALQGVFPARP